MNEIYFDNAATTRTNKEIAGVMYKIMTDNYGNPSSLHKKGLEAEHIVKEAREIIANRINAERDDIIFTASGSEANNLALIGFAKMLRYKGEIITSSVEHKCVLECMRFLENEGFKIHYVNVDKNGIVDLEQIRALVNDKTQLVSIMSVNNECGAIQPIEEIYNIVKTINPNTVVHTDNIQGFCKIDVTARVCDMMSISAHKIHGPKGIGALYVRKGIRLAPVIYGGGQERGLRGGTENVPAVAGFGIAVKNADYCSKYVKISEIKKYIANRVTNEIPKVFINGDCDLCSPFILNIAMLGLRSEIILHSLEQRGIYVSSGSACSSNRPSPSHVLVAMGFKPDRVDSSIRLSFDCETTFEEADAFCDALLQISDINKKVRRI